MAYKRVVHHVASIKEDRKKKTHTHTHIQKKKKRASELCHESQKRAKKKKSRTHLSASFRYASDILHSAFLWCQRGILTTLVGSL